MLSPRATASRAQVRIWPAPSSAQRARHGCKPPSSACGSAKVACTAGAVRLAQSSADAGEHVFARLKASDRRAARASTLLLRCITSMRDLNVGRSRGCSRGALRQSMLLYTRERNRAGAAAARRPRRGDILCRRRRQGVQHPLASSSPALHMCSSVALVCAHRSATLATHSSTTSPRTGTSPRRRRSRRPCARRSAAWSTF